MENGSVWWWMFGPPASRCVGGAQATTHTHTHTDRHTHSHTLTHTHAHTHTHTHTHTHLVIPVPHNAEGGDLGNSPGVPRIERCRGDICAWTRTWRAEWGVVSANSPQPGTVNANEMFDHHGTPKVTFACPAVCSNYPPLHTPRGPDASDGDWHFGLLLVL